jgi:ABC-2 type transport system permease protein
MTGSRTGDSARREAARAGARGPAAGYAAILSARCRVLLQYRAAAVAGLATQLFWGLIRVMIFEAFYASTHAVQPMTLSQVISYVWLGQSLFRMMPWAPDPDVRQQVRTGAVAIELLRPLDLYAVWYCRALASSVAPTVLRALPTLALALAFLGLAPPASPAALAAWGASVGAAVLLAAAFAALQSVVLLVTISGEGLAQLVPITVYVCSGVAVPLPLLPGPLRAVLEWLPFRGVMDTPLRLWTGHIPASEAPALIAHQLAWAVAVAAAGRLLLRRLLCRLEVHGG